MTVVTESDVELADCACVIGFIVFLQKTKVRQQQRRHVMPGKIFFGLNDLARRLGHTAKHAGISKRFAAGYQQFFDELHALPVRKRKFLLQE